MYLFFVQLFWSSAIHTTGILMNWSFHFCIDQSMESLNFQNFSWLEVSILIHSFNRRVVSAFPLGLFQESLVGLILDKHCNRCSKKGSIYLTYTNGNHDQRVQHLVVHIFLHSFFENRLLKSVLNGRVHTILKHWVISSWALIRLSRPVLLGTLLSSSPSKTRRSEF